MPVSAKNPNEIWVKIYSSSNESWNISKVLILERIFLEQLLPFIILDCYFILMLENWYEHWSHVLYITQFNACSAWMCDHTCARIWSWVCTCTCVYVCIRSIAHTCSALITGEGISPPPTTYRRLRHYESSTHVIPLLKGDKHWKKILFQCLSPHLLFC